MSNKFNYEGYTITVTFKNEFSCSATASLNLTGEHFMNEAVELTKIKKDTVLATLSRKSQKNLRCEFNMVDAEPRKLIISFIVSFDYLPEFREDITLEQIEAKNEIFNKVSSAEIQSDILALENVLNSIQSNGTVMIREKTQSLPAGSKSEIEKIKLEKGKYLLQITGVFTCTTANQEVLEFIIEVKNEKPIQLQVKTNCMSSYGYPYAVSKSIDVSQESEIIITGWSKTASIASSLANHMTTITPIICL